MTAFLSDTKLADQHTIDFKGKLLRSFLAHIGIISRPQSRFVTGGANPLTLIWALLRCTVLVGYLTDFDIRCSVFTVLVGYYGKLWRSYLEFTAAGDFTKGKTLTTAPGGSRTCTTTTKKRYFLRSWGVPTQIWKVKNQCSNTTSRYKNKAEKSFGANVNNF